MSLLPSAQWRAASLSVLLVVGAHLAPAQSTPAKGYDFLTVTTAESGAKSLSKLFITPAFQGKAEVQLENFNALTVKKDIEKAKHNIEIINQQLSDLTVAGWELVQAYPVAFAPDLQTTRYLFRKAKN